MTPKEEEIAHEMLASIDDFPPMTAVIVYRDGSGKLKDWVIGAAPNRDTEETIKAHLHTYLPAAEFIGYVIK